MMNTSVSNRGRPATAPYNRPVPTEDADATPFFSDDELLQVMAPPPADQAVPAPEVSGQARALARMLGAQYAEIIAHYAIDALAGRQSKHAPKLEQIIRNFKRLATEMGDLELLRLYEQLAELSEAFESSPSVDMRMLASQRLRDWVMTFADLVGGEAAQKLRKLVVFKKGVHPLISHLREIRGIGEKRLERLYAAGLLTTETLAEAHPAELGQVMGVTRRLARQVIEACQRFAESQRQTHVRSLKNVVGEVARVLQNVDPNDDSHVRLVAAVRETIAELERAVREMEASWNQRHGST